MLFKPKEKGQSLVEYALLLILIAMVVILVLRLFGETLISMFNQVVNSF